jgi:selenocysteine-specific elongation factor
MTHVIGTAGHVDHGKSTLVKALTGIDPDRLAEEKAREMTIDLGFAWLTLPDGETVGIVDVPGHRDFIENMLAGVGGIDLALLVIAADEGVMPQTREHLAILDLLEIPAGLVALTKTDMVAEPGWLDLVTADIDEILKGTTLEGAPVVPVSAKTGAGLEALVTALQSALARQSPRPDQGRPCLPVDRVFSMTGFGTVITGTLSGGSLSVGDEIQIAPSGHTARIRGLQSHREAIQIAHPGSRVAINFAGLDKSQIQRGDVVALPGLLTGTQLVDVRFRQVQDSHRSLAHNATVKFFSGAAEVVAQVRLLGDRELLPGAEGWLQLRLEKPLALDKGDRFILRYPSPGQTIGGGSVLDPHPAHRWRRFKPEVIARFETLTRGSPDELILNVLASQVSLHSDDVLAQSGLDQAPGAQALAALLSRGAVIDVGEGWLISRSRWERLAGQLTQELTAFHATNPLKAGMPREALRSRLEIDPRVFNRLIALASEESILADEGIVLRLPGHQVRFSPQQQATIDRLRAMISAQPMSPPGIKEAQAVVGEDVLQVMVEQGELQQAGPEVLFDAQTYRLLVDQIRAFITQNGSITVAQARDLFQTSRKYALALLEHLDEIGITRRVGDERVLKDPANR